MSFSRNLALYNGVSDRSRGWKRRKSDVIVDRIETHVSTNPQVKRWDGAAQSSSAWDGLRRDPELWHHEGNCYVHLYGQGHSRRGPSFKLPLSALLEAGCYPLLDRFMPQVIEFPAASSTPGETPGANSSLKKRQPRVDLFIPAPAGSDKHQSFNHHIATRNFFAFICRKSLVGEHLGIALASLMEKMYEFRSPDVNNTTDLLSYMGEEGYLDLKNQPSHALAVLHLAEVFQLRDLYIDAFAHCCGMGDQLFLNPDYQVISSVTRKLLRRARVERDLRLGQMGSMLTTFLQDELSEAHLGLYPGARAHLERFRTLLHGFYAAKFGYYPPPSIDPRTTIFELDVIRTMRDDFEALVNYLVDETFDPSQGSPLLAQGGICTLQSVQSFDERYRFNTLDHPLPLLPQITRPTPQRRISWFNKYTKAGNSDRVTTHAALLRATNQNNTELMGNELVRTYRRFEEDSVYSPLKADKLEGIGCVDARKVRWILIYAIYQTLKQATQPPPEVRDSAGAPYHTCISTHNLPPWKEELPFHSLVRMHADQVIRNPSVSTSGWSSSTRYQTPPSSPYLEIKPDIDYFALTHKDDETESGAASTPRSSRRASLTSSLSRNGSVRRSLKIFTRQHSLPITDRPRSASQYQEIIVQRYGNGILAPDLNPQERQQTDDAATPTKSGSTGITTRSASISSNASVSSKHSNSEGSTASTDDSSPTVSVEHSPTTPCATTDLSWGSRRSNVLARGLTRNISFRGAAPRPVSMCAPSKSVRFSSEVLDPSPLATRGDKTPQGLREEYRKSMEPPPLNIRKTRIVTFRDDNDDDDDDDNATDDVFVSTPRSLTNWESMKALLETRAAGLPNTEDDIKPHWDNYNDLGGLTELKY